MSNIVRVWDLPTRVFHWALVVCLVGLVTSAQIGGEAMSWHFRAGYAVLSLLLFRLVWGLVGGKWSRFASFIYAPSTILGYLRGEGTPEQSVGHNPLGSLSVFALLVFLLMQVASGMFSDDEIAAAGPMVKFASGAVVSAATFYHTELGKLAVLGLVAMHIGAILFYRLRKGQNLVMPMIKGDKESSVMIESSRDDAKSRLLALLIAAGCAALVFWVLKQAG